MSEASPPDINLSYETPPRHGNASMLVRLAGIFSIVSSGIDLLYAIGMIAMAVFMYYTISSMPAGAFVVAPAPVMVPPLPPPPGPAPVAPELPAAPETAPALPPAPPAIAPPAAVPAAPLPPGAFPPAPAPGPPVPLPMAELYIVLSTYGGPGILSLLVITPKLIGGIKLLRRGKRAWGWGLATGIIGCTQLWMIMPCCVPVILPMGAGIFTIVVLCLPHVRAYLTGTRSQLQM